MTLRNSERTYLYKEKKPFKFHGFFFFLSGIRKSENTQRLRVERIKNLAPNYFGVFNKKKLPTFDKSLEYLHQTMLSFKGIRS